MVGKITGIILVLEFKKERMWFGTIELWTMIIVWSF